MTNNTDLVKTCNNCESQEFSRFTYAGESFYRCFHCESVDDYRMAPEQEELELTSAEWAARNSQLERKPAARALHHDYQEHAK